MLRTGVPLRLTISRGEESLAEFDLEAGERLLGGDEHADLVLPVAVCAGSLCKLEVSYDGRVAVSAVGGPHIKDCAGVVAARRPLTHASFVDVGDLRLSLLRVTSRAAVAVEVEAQGLY